MPDRTGSAGRCVLLPRRGAVPFLLGHLQPTRLHLLRPRPNRAILSSPNTTSTPSKLTDSLRLAPGQAWSSLLLVLVPRPALSRRHRRHRHRRPRLSSLQVQRCEFVLSKSLHHRLSLDSSAPCANNSSSPRSTRCQGLRTSFALHLPCRSLLTRPQLDFVRYSKSNRQLSHRPSSRIGKPALSTRPIAPWNAARQLVTLEYPPAPIPCEGYLLVPIGERLADRRPAQSQSSTAPSRDLPAPISSLLRKPLVLVKDDATYSMLSSITTTDRANTS